MGAGSAHGQALGCAHGRIPTGVRTMGGQGMRMHPEGFLHCAHRALCASEGVGAVCPGKGAGASG